MAKIITLILAAGHSRRYSEAAGGKQNKLLAQLPTGLSVLEQSLRTLCTWSDDYLIIVNAHNASTIEKLGKLKIPGEKILNCDSKGMGESLAHGVNATKNTKNLQGWLIALADMPWLKPETLELFKHQIKKTPNNIIRPLYKKHDQQQGGHPVYFPFQYADELGSLNGDAGAKVVLARHNEKLVTFEVNDAGVVKDVDKPEDLSLSLS